MPKPQKPPRRKPRLQRTRRALRQVRSALTIPGILLALAALATAGSYFLLEPTTVTVAVSADEPLDQKVFRAAAELFHTQRASVRLKVVETTRDDAASVENGKIDLAVVRPEFAGSQAQTIVLLRREAAILIAPKKSKIQKTSELVKLKIGFFDDKGKRLIGDILRFYGAGDTPSLVALKPDDTVAVLQQNRVDAIIVAGVATTKTVAQQIALVQRGWPELKFLDIDEAKAIEKRVPTLQAVEIEAGTFGGSPARPEESIDTLGHTIRLVARPGLNVDVVADLTRQLVAARQNLAAAVPDAGLLEVPDTSDNSTFVIHAGVKAFANGDRTTLFDRYGDWFYMILFAGSGLGSAIAMAVGWVQARRRSDALNEILRIEQVLEDIRAAKSLRELEDLDTQCDTIFRLALRKAVQGELGDTQIMTFEMAMRDARHRLEVQKSLLSTGKTERRKDSGVQRAAVASKA